MYFIQYFTKRTIRVAPKKARKMLELGVVPLDWVVFEAMVVVDATVDTVVESIFLGVVVGPVVEVSENNHF